MSVVPDRTCPDCGKDRVISTNEARRIYSNLDDHKVRAIERAENDPYTDHVCSYCWSEVRPKRQRED